MKFHNLLDNVAEAIPAYRKPIFRTIITGLLIGKSGGTIAGIFRQFACLFVGTVITRKRFYTFLNSRFIRWVLIWQRVVDLLRPYVLVAGRLLVVLDDTTYGKTGKKISGCSVHHDHSAKANASRRVFGHCRVVAGVLLWAHGRWACLPLAQKNFVPLKKENMLSIHSGVRKKTVYSRKQKRHEQWQKTKCGIAAALIDALRLLFGMPVLVVCDSWFGNYSLLRELRRNLHLPQVHILSRLRVSCVLHELPHQPEKHKRGRHRTYGRRLPALEKLAAQMRPYAQTESIFIYGKARQCTYSQLTCVSKALRCQVKVVFIHRGNRRFFPLIATDLSLTAKQMIEYYAARWKIESGFKELKHEIGAIDSQCRTQNAVENHFNLCCLAMSLTWIYSLTQPKPPKRRHPTRHATAFAFADIRRAIADEFREQPIFPMSCPELVKRAIKMIRQRLFNSAT